MLKFRPKEPNLNVVVIQNDGAKVFDGQKGKVNYKYRKINSILSKFLSNWKGLMWKPLYQIECKRILQFILGIRLNFGNTLLMKYNFLEHLMWQINIQIYPKLY